MNTKGKRSLQVAVVGGGLSGVCLTLGLVNRGIDVKLYEKAPVFGEYGAGLGIESNGVMAMKICDPAIYDDFVYIAKYPSSSTRPDVFFEWVDGRSSPLTGCWYKSWDGVSAGVHRGELLEIMTRRLPTGVAQMNKQLHDIVEDGADRPCRLLFTDGTWATADVVIGCDGIGSRVRRYLVGATHPSARAQYSYQYVYRMVLPIEKTVEAVGHERAQINTIFASPDSYTFSQMGKNARIVLIPMSGGRLSSVAGVVKDSADWPDENSLIMPAQKADVLRDFADFAPELRALLANVSDKVDKWALSDLATSPIPYFAKGRVCVAGDAAHATTPHLGGGANFALEDVAVLAEVLAHDRVAGGGVAEVTSALEAYDLARRSRGQWLPRASRLSGDLQVFANETAKDNLEKVTDGIRDLGSIAWGADVPDMINTARTELERLLAVI